MSLTRPSPSTRVHFCAEWLPIAIGSRHRRPFPQGDLEATRWYAGWDDSFRSDEPWTQREAILLLTLAADGERLSAVASRMGKTEDAVRIECKRLNLALSDDRIRD